MSFALTVGLTAGIAAAFSLPAYTARLNLPAFVTVLFLFGYVERIIITQSDTKRGTWDTCTNVIHVSPPKREIAKLLGSALHLCTYAQMM